VAAIGVVAASRKPPPAKPKAKGKPKPILKGRLVRLIPTQVTISYSFKNKKTGKIIPMRTTSKPLVLKVVKPAKGKPRLDKSRRRR